MKNIKYLTNKFNKFSNKHPNVIFYLFYGLIFFLAAAIIFARFPYNYIHPNFFAEDGSVFVSNIIHKGLLKSIYTSFNGYFIVGLYFLTATGVIIDKVLFHSSFLELPRIFSVMSYGFFAFTITLPVILFRKELKYYWAFVLVLISAFVPMRNSDYAIIGTIGNLKWLFFYLAFLLIIYRYFNYKKKWIKLIPADILILICAYTNSTVYLLLPIIFIPYFVEIASSKKSISNFKISSITKSFWSGCVLALLLVPQLLYVKINGIQKITGYLDSSFKYSRAVEIFIGRSFEFGILYGSYKSLNNIFAVIIFVTSIIILYFIYDKRYRPILFIAVYAIISSTLLFVINRPGISDFFNGYAGGGPDQFFYTQNLIVFFMVVAAFAKYNISKDKKYLLSIIIVLFILVNFPAGNSLGGNRFMYTNRGDIYNNLYKICATNEEHIILPIYPSEGWEMPLDKATACKMLAKYEK